MKIKMAIRYIITSINFMSASAAALSSILNYTHKRFVKTFEYKFEEQRRPHLFKSRRQLTVSWSLVADKNHVPIRWSSTGME